jgi:hypothetical protein
MRHAAQSLQASNYVLHGLRRLLHHFQDGLFQPLDPRTHVLDFVQAIHQRDFLCRLCVADLRQAPSALAQIQMQVTDKPVLAGAVIPEGVLPLY